MSLDFFTFTRNSVATATLQDGTLSNVAVDVPVINFRDGAFAGYYSQIEATNLLQRSEDFTSVVWNKLTGTTISSDSVTLPDGTTGTLNTINWTGTAGVTQNVTLTAGVTYTFSVYLRADAPGVIQLRTTDNTSSGLKNVNVTTEWKRFDLVITPVDVNDGGIYIRRQSNSMLSKVYAWGAQLETGSVATEYIKTTSASATRDEDVATATNVASKLGLTAGSVSITALFPTNYPLIVNGLQATVSGTKTIRFEYTTTTIELYVDNVLVDSATGTYDWGDLNEIQLGHYNGTDQPNFELRDLIVRKA